MMVLQLRGDDDQLLDGFTSWATSRGLTLYPHQADALLELVAGSHVICSTPTGSGKSLIAVAAHAVALARGQRTYYTAPLKALVSEKFFDLADIFGPEQVGMLTGDSAINPGAPIICCTAEVLANQVLREGELTPVGQVVMDEFHFYADPQRGWAWQLPLLELPNTQFLLLSATLGAVDFFAEDLTRRTGRSVASITNTERPVPLEFSYSTEPLMEVISELTSTHRAPVYIVNFTQAAAVELATALLSVNVATKETKAAIAEFIGDFNFSRGFGATLSRLVRQGIGVHHAGMLPRYRRLVERLAQAGLLRVICGTDTLGVGINVPIRTVVLTGLTKFDGVKSRHLSAREFHQIAGRAGRAGYDDRGYVIVQAPEHVIENAKALAKAGDDERKRRKIVRKKAPSGAVNWTDKTFERLRDADPEALTSQFRVTHAMVLGVLNRWGDPVAAMAKLVHDNHEPPTDRNLHLRSAIRIYRTLREAGIVEKLGTPDAQGRQVRLVQEVPDDLALNAPLSTFALAVMDVLDPADPGYALDVISVIESIMENPRPVLIAQEKAARGRAIAEMKADGMEYTERMNALDDITYPQPLAELLGATFSTYSHAHPWALEHRVSPKSVVRSMVEVGMTFQELISHHNIARSEGVVLRYLTDVYKATRQLIPAHRITPELEEISRWLGHIVTSTDSSLLTEWEQLTKGEESGSEAGTVGPPVIEQVASVIADEPSFRMLVRGKMFRLVELLDQDRYDDLAQLDQRWSVDRWFDSFDPYWDDHDHLGTGPNARGPQFFSLTTAPEELPPSDEDRTPGQWWYATQVIEDPAGDHDWRISAWIDLQASADSDQVQLIIDAVGPLTSSPQSLGD